MHVYEKRFPRQNVVKRGYSDLMSPAEARGSNFVKLLRVLAFQLTVRCLKA